jgi:preprotein translocase subunit SecE
MARGREAGGRSIFRERRQTAMASKNPVEFGREVRREIAKVTWPTRKETMITTGMVFVMVILASLFFLVVDQVLGFGVRAILGLGA